MVAKSLLPLGCLLAIVSAPTSARGASCASQQDCDEERVCASAPPAPGCEGGDAGCGPTATGVCAFRWQLPCAEDRDCGDGFRCRCRGSDAQTDAGRSLAVKSDAGGEPSCTAAQDGICWSRVESCQEDVDCPRPWSCALGQCGPPDDLGPVETWGPPTLGKDAGTGSLIDKQSTVNVPAQPEADAGGGAVKTAQAPGCTLHGGRRPAPAWLLVGLAALLLSRVRRRRRHDQNSI